LGIGMSILGQPFSSCDDHFMIPYLRRYFVDAVIQLCSFG
jgi:hypothetical protein